MKKICLVLLSTLITGVVAAQTPRNVCASDIVLQEELAKNPVLAAQHAAYINDLKAWLAANPHVGEKNTSGIRIIPVVFHIIHDGGSENISKAQVLDQVDILNEDFRRLNADAATTPPHFDSLAADCRIEFRLANTDPQGNCTDGIVRVQSQRTNGASNVNGVKELSFWGCEKYFNIWVVKDIGGTSALGTIIGYAQFPLGGLCKTDGVVLTASFTGSIGTAAGRKGRTATHEAGHWLGLRHIWGDSDCGNDFITDTPIHKAANFGCFTYPKINDCEGGDTIHGEMFMNYMDYSDDYCMNMFTKGQKDVMDWTLEGPADSVPGLLGAREKLWLPENLQATGVLNNPPQACAPIADFFANRRMICEGATVTFDDNSYNGTVSSRQWTLEGANSPSPTSASPTATYANAGLYDASITATNSVGSSSITKSDYIIVSSNTAEKTAPFYFEDFTGWLDPRFLIFNDDNEIYRWEYNGLNGNGFMEVKNYGNFDGAVEELITPSYDLTAVNSPSLRFIYSGAARDTSYNCSLRVSYSTNCGQSWTPRATITGPALANAGLFQGPYEPWNIQDWATYSVSLPANVQNKSNVRFKFEFTNGGGANNFYIDNINITDPTSVTEDLASQINLNLFPNPTNGTNPFLLFQLDNAEKVNVDITDMVGRVVGSVYSGSMGAGKQTIQLDNNMFTAAGVYFVRLQVGNKTAVKKLIVAGRQ